MINAIWYFMIIVGIVYSLINNNVKMVNDLILNTTSSTISTMLPYFANLLFFSGLLEIVSNNGMLDAFSRRIKFFTGFLFKDLDQDSDAIKYISGNIAANILGLGSAATPFGLKAMKELQNISNDKYKATKEMITLLLINTSGLTLIPTTIIAIREGYNSNFVVELIPIIIMSTILTTIFAVVIDALFKYKFKNS